MAITQDITSAPTPPTSSDATNFRTRADAFVSWIATFVSQIQTWTTQLNSTETNINSKEASAVIASDAAVAAANFKGTWNSGTAYAVPSSVEYNGLLYLALQASTNQNPSTQTAYWMNISISSQIHSATSKTTPVDADEIGIWDSVSSALRKLTLSNLWLYNKSKADLLYSPIDPSGSVIKVGSYNTSSVATGTNIIPFDDTAPQITEGTQFMSVVFTPKKTNSIIFIIVSANFSSSVAGHTIMALFDGSSDALAVRDNVTTSTNSPQEIALVHAYNNTTGAAKTFSVRAGPNGAATLTLNGAAGSRYFGGVHNSTMLILEVAI